jgi:Cu(I)/Ag(I) efflux system membrane protein CusA/SilA
MFFAAMLGITVVPVLMLLLVRGKITPEAKNPVNRFLTWAYQPFVNFVLRFRWLTLIAAVLVLVATIYPYSKLGKEFMPPLNEGTILYMPTAVPGMSSASSAKRDNPKRRPTPRRWRCSRPSSRSNRTTNGGLA